MKPTFQLTKGLDFSLEGTQKRIDKITEILEEHDQELVDYYDNHFIANKTSTSFEQDLIGQDLEKMADYLLYADNKEQREKSTKEKDERGILSKSQQERNLRKEILSNDISSFEQTSHQASNYSFYSENQKFKNKMDCEEEKPKRRKSKNKTTDNKKIKKADFEKYPILKDTQTLIDNLKNQIKTGLDENGNELTADQLRKKKWLAIELKKDQVAYKDSMKKYVNAKSVLNQNSTGKLDVHFADHEVIEFLFHEYSLLKQHCFDDLGGDLKHILMDFERIVDATPFSEVMKTIFILKIDGLSREQIIEKLEELYEITFSKKHISQLIRSAIPKKIIETYKQLFDNWYYLEIVKGTYKQCKKCKEVYLLKNNQFYKDYKEEDGLKQICKSCFRKNR